MDPGDAALSPQEEVHDRRGDPLLPEYSQVDSNGGSNSNGDAPNECIEEDVKVCRICLEEDQPEEMIAPCKCKGGSKWVHRSCLDLWRTNQRDRAFSQCTECLFQYHLQPPQSVLPSRRRKVKFCWLVSRDLCGVTLCLQAVIVALGACVYLMDPQQEIAAALCATPECLHGNWHSKGIYYLCGFLLFLVMLGIAGCVVLCSNKCSIQNSIPASLQESRSVAQGDAPTPMRSAAPSESERLLYRRHRQRNASRDGCCACCHDSGMVSSRPRYGGHRTTVSDDLACYYCCEGCCRGCAGCGDVCDGCQCCDGCNTGGGGSGSNDCDGMQVFIIFLVIVAIVMAIVGFVVGIVIAVLLFQRTVQNHLHLVQKRELVKEFTVMDLSAYDMDGPLPNAPPCEIPPPDEDIELQTGQFEDGLKKATKMHPETSSAQASSHPPPSAPVLQEDDELYLQKMGLLD